jgi:glyoxylase-like metal-dependent hydrolase (beta-lactamase superfamily II)
MAHFRRNFYLLFGRIAKHIFSPASFYTLANISRAAADAIDSLHIFYDFSIINLKKRFIIAMQNLSEVRPNLFLLDLPQPSHPGYRQFISAWILRRGKRAWVVDPGPGSTITELGKALNYLGCDDLAAILLTHIHLDHGGGSGHLLRQFPTTKVVCHSRARAHLIDPRKLYAGSIEVLGEVARTFGEPLPIAADNLVHSDRWPGPEADIEIFPTPGHAAHHQSFYYDDMLFCGEACGTTIAGNDFYVRLATPPRFIRDIFVASINACVERQPAYLCMGHFGLHQHCEEIMQGAKEQVDRWLDFIARPEQERDSSEEIFTKLRRQDPLLAPFSELPADIQQREIFFAANSIRGMRAYLKARTTLALQR